MANEREPTPFKMYQASYALLGNVESPVLRQNEGRTLAELGLLTGIDNPGHQRISRDIGAGQGSPSGFAPETLPLLTAVARFAERLAPDISPETLPQVFPGRPTILLQDRLDQLLDDLDSDDPAVRQAAQAALRELARELPETIESWLDRQLSPRRRPRLSPEQRNTLTLLKADFNLARRTRQLANWAEAHIEEFFDPTKQPGFIYSRLEEFAQLVETEPRLFSDRPNLPMLQRKMADLLQNLRMRKDTLFSETQDAQDDLKEFADTIFDLLRAGNREHQLGKILTPGEERGAIDSQQRLRDAALPSDETTGERRARLEEELRAWREERTG
jgi:hypothetical protein